MKRNINDKIKRFLTSETGRTGVKSPLVLGVSGGAFLLSQVVATPSAEASLSCLSDADCDSGGECKFWCSEKSEGTCVNWNSACFY